ncbi:MAG: hypothetical protein EWM48_10640 [Sphaerochaeta sp.]|nr:MAG: hypothetical protein EWM48_10640 [Sphaerochaeta sp.]
MLHERRLLAFSSRVHTYTLFLYLFFFLLYMLGGFFLVDTSFEALLSFLLKLVGYSSIIFGVWVLAFSVVVWFVDKVFPLSPIFFTILRIGAVVLMATLIEIINTLVHRGLSIQWGG